MRPATACYSCRHGKRKCRPSKDEATAACARCLKMQIPCSLTSLASKSMSNPQPPPSPETYHHHASPVHRPSNDGGLSGPDDLSSNDSWSSRRRSHDPLQLDPLWKQEMVDHYFDVVHEKNHALFHRPTFESDLHSNQIADVILYAVLSLGSRFSSAPQRHSHHFTERAYQALDMRDPSLTTIQGCILLGTLCYVDGKSEAEALYYATALRLGLILNLPQRHCATELERQINLRVWWTLYMIDIWSSAGLKLSRQLTFREDVELPLEESQFLRLSCYDPYRTDRSQATGIWGEMARLACLWAEIQDFNTTSVEHHLTPMSLTTRIDDLALKLEQWKRNLPPFLEETRENLERAAALGLGPLFAALHLGFHYYHEVLFYQFMAESHENPSPLANSYADSCAAHAQAFCDLLYLCERTASCQCRYAMVGHMLVVTSTVLMHMLLFGHGEQPQAPATIRERLEHNFEILTRLQTHWAMLDTSLARLKVFHNACLYSIEHSFSMDRWMLRFILEHGSNMPDKFAVLPDGTTQILLGTDEGDVAGDGAGNLQDWYSQTLS